MGAPQFKKTADFSAHPGALTGIAHSPRLSRKHDSPPHTGSSSLANVTAVQFPRASSSVDFNTAQIRSLRESNPGNPQYNLLQQIEMLDPSKADFIERLTALKQQAQDTLAPKRQHPLLTTHTTAKTGVTTADFIAKQQALGATKPITHVLVWNSGMACRLLEQRCAEYAAKICGDADALKIISVINDDDKEAKFNSKQGHEQIRLPGKAKDTYSNIETYKKTLREAIAIARQQAGDDACVAIHPGWGFISEAPEAELAVKEILAEEQVKHPTARPPLVFVGPPAEPMQLLGDKKAGKDAARAADVPVIPGSIGYVTDANDAIRIMQEQNIQTAVLKAVAGGGGKGIRVISNDPEEIKKKWAEVQTEAANMPSQQVILEEFLSDRFLKHIEVQFIADQHGNVVIVDERDCSSQIKQQKVIEESAEESVDKAERQAFFDRRLALRKQIEKMVTDLHYVGAGTAEFLYGKRNAEDKGENRFFFCEVNTRLQVEHPVTEMHRDVQLPVLQLAVAAGIPLKDTNETQGIFSANDLSDFENTDGDGHVIALRITASDPYTGGATTGSIKQLSIPQNTDGMRCYFSVEQGSEITGNTDAQLGHIFIKAPNRKEAILRAITALENLHIDGVETNRDFLIKWLQSEEFQSNQFGIKTLETKFIPAQKSAQNQQLQTAIMAEGLRQYQTAKKEDEQEFNDRKDCGLPLPILKNTKTITVCHEGNHYPLTITSTGENQFSINGLGVTLTPQGGNDYRMKIDGHDDVTEPTWTDVAYIDERNVSIDHQRAVAFGDPSLCISPNAGRVLKVLVQEGQEVKEGDDLYTIEVAKAMHTVKAGRAGKIHTLNVKENHLIGKGETALRFALPEDFKKPEPTKLWQAKEPIAPVDLTDCLIDWLKGKQQNSAALAQLEQQITSLANTEQRDESLDKSAMLAWHILLHELIRYREVASQDKITLEDQYRLSIVDQQLKLFSAYLTHLPTWQALPPAHQEQLVTLASEIDEIANQPRAKLHYAQLLNLARTLKEKIPELADHLSHIKTFTSSGNKNRDFANKLDVEYVYDYPNRMQEALAKQWQAAGKEISADAFSAEELIVENGQLIPTDRAEGKNTSSVVIWQVTLKLPGEPEPRRMIFGANDLSIKFGSMAIADDEVYVAAAEKAMAEKIPFSFSFSGAGARVIPNTEVKNKCRWGKDIAEQLQADQLYLTQADFDAFNQKQANTVFGEAIHLGDAIYYRVTGITSQNQSSLHGAGKMLEATLKANAEIPCFASVSHIAVGKQTYAWNMFPHNSITEDSAAILTGIRAINAGLGREAYRDNKELGSHSVQAQSGSTAYTAEDFSGLMAQNLTWLSLQPTQALDQASVTAIAQQQPFQPKDLHHELLEKKDEQGESILLDATGEPKTYDPKQLVGAIADENAALLEHSKDFGTSIRTYSGKLGGIPVAFIASDPRTSSRIQVPDPAKPKSLADRSEAFAGSVWDPESSIKTAAFIENAKGPIVFMPNLRGFKGSTTDLLERIIPNGSRIAEAFRTAKHPVIIWLPPHTQLRGGAWAVMDTSMSREGRIKIFADSLAHLGTLEGNMILTLPEVTRDIAEKVKTARQLAASQNKFSDEIDQIAAATKEAEEQTWLAISQLQDDPRVAALQTQVKVIETAQAHQTIYKTILAGYGVTV